MYNSAKLLVEGKKNGLITLLFLNICLMCQNDYQHFKRFNLVLDLLHQQSPSPQPLLSSAMNLHTPLSLSTI